MALLFNSLLPSLSSSSKHPNPTKSHFSLSRPQRISFSLIPSSKPKISSTRLYSTVSGDLPDPLSEKPPKISGEKSAGETTDDENKDVNVADEWGEKSEPEPETEGPTRLPEADPPRDEDEWGGVQYVATENGNAAPNLVDEKVEDLKRCLVDTFYGTELGFRASAEVRAEVLELVAQLEAVNPTPAPTEAVELLDGNWILLYTAFSELLPLLAAGAIPLVKVEKISQSINTRALTIDNSTTLSSPFATFSFSASAAFEVRSPSRIQVQFKEGVLQPPEVKSTLNLPENVDIFGQKINLLPVQQSLNPLQDAVASIARVISGQPPLKVPIPGDRTQSWLLTTYLDKDLRISRGDGGLFVLAKEGSPLLD